MYERDGRKKRLTKAMIPTLSSYLFFFFIPLIPSFLTGKREAELLEILKRPLTALSI